MQPEVYFAPFISSDLITILNDIREVHKKDTTTADEDTVAVEVARSSHTEKASGIQRDVVDEPI